MRTECIDEIATSVDPPHPVITGVVQKDEISSSFYRIKLACVESFPNPVKLLFANFAQWRALKFPIDWCKESDQSVWLLLDNLKGIDYVRICIPDNAPEIGMVSPDSEK